MKKIKFLDLKKINETPLIKTQSKIKKFLFNGNYILDKNVLNFEKKFSKFNKSSFCVGVNSGHDALKIALNSLGNIRNKKIIVPGLTFISTYMAISELGGIPVPIDIGYDGVLDVTKLPRKTDKNTVGILAVNLYGNLCNYSFLRKYCNKNKIFLLEDSSQSHGAYFLKNKKRKFWGDAAAFSFYPSKNLGAISDGGCIVTNNKKLFKRSLLLRNYGSSKKYIHEILGYNSRLNSMSAVFLNEKIKRLNLENSVRRKQEIIYRKELKDIEDVIFLKRNPNVNSAHHICLILTKKRNQLKKYLERKKIEIIIHYPIIPIEQPCYKKFFKKIKLPISKYFASNALSLPLGSHISADLQKKIIFEIKKFFN